MKRNLILRAAVAGLILASSAVAAHASGPQRVFTAFYSDESMTQQVGFVVVFCDGTRARGGMPTFYSETFEYECP